MIKNLLNKNPFIVLKATLTHIMTDILITSREDLAIL